MTRSTLDEAQSALVTGRACAVQIRTIKIRTIKNNEVWNDF